MVCRAKRLTMDEFIFTKIGYLKFLLSFLLSYSIPCHIMQAAYPLERDVDELTRISPSKLWIPFMERLAKICLNDVKIKPSMTSIDVLMCVTIRGTSQCLSTTYISGCILTNIHPNFLQYENMFPLFGGLPIQIIVHRQFSLNITVEHVNTVHFEDAGPSFEIMGGRYTEQNLSTVIIPSNNLEIIFYSPSSIEYNVAQHLNNTNFNKLRAHAMHFRLGYILVTCFQIQVDIGARLSLDNITCLLCKIIVYDGPNEKLPIIVKINYTNQFQTVVASTFQVFIVIIEHVPQKDVLMTYAPVYKTKTVFNLTEYEYIEINFDNSTWCDGHSWHARSCVYAFHTSVWSRRQIRFSLLDSQFTETYTTTKYKAGVIVFNHFNGTTEKIVKLNYNFAVKNSFFEIIGTGYTMHIVILVYSILSSLTLIFAMSLSDCDVLLVSGNYISYSGYVVPMDDTLRVFKMTQSLQALQKYDRCLRLQFITPLSTYRMIFPHNTPIKIAEYNGELGMCRFCSYTCPMSFKGPSHASYNIGDQIVIRTVESFEIEPCSLRYAQLVINWLPCKIPCNLGYG